MKRGAMMASLRYLLIAVCCSWLPLLNIASPAVETTKLDTANCERVVEAQRQGMISAADFDTDPSCRRVFITRGDEKLSFSFIRVEMAEREKLVLEFNGERYEFGPKHVCDLCLPKLVTNKLSLALVPVAPKNISASSSSLTDVDDPSIQPVREKSLGEVILKNETGKIDIHDVMINDVDLILERVESKFTVLYQTFDPDSCPPPSSLQIRHGYVKGKDARLGAEIEFKCKTPFDPSPAGSLKATCIVEEDGIPSWSQPPPKCSIRCDSHKFVVRKVAKNLRTGGALPAISNPGHESNLVSGGSEVCKWELRAPEGNFVNLRIHYVDLPNLGDDLSFLSIKADGAKEPIVLTGVVPPRNVTVPAQRVFVEFYGPKDVYDSRTGFYLSYSARTAVPCPVPAVEHGMVFVEERPTVDAVVDMGSISCAPGFAATSNDMLTCHQNGTWHREFPECLMTDVEHGGGVGAESGSNGDNGNAVWNGTTPHEFNEEYTSFLDEIEEAANGSNSSQLGNATLVQVLDIMIVEEETRRDSSSSSSSPSSTTFSVGDLDLEKTQVLGLQLWLFLAIVGAAVLLLLSCLCCVCCAVVLARRRRYPGGGGAGGLGVSSGGPLGLGRKFDTFENPIYSRVNLRPPPTLSSIGGGLSPDDSRGASRLSHVLDDVICDPDACEKLKPSDDDGAATSEEEEERDADRRATGDSNNRGKRNNKDCESGKCR